MKPDETLVDAMELDDAACWTPGQRRLYARVEDAGLNASAPPQQVWMDGWLVRFSPGKAKRARCVNAVAASVSPSAELLDRAARIYDDAALPMVVRITPFTQPSDLDAMLAARDWARIDDTRVMVCEALSGMLASAAAGPTPAALGGEVRRVGVHAFAQAVGALRGSPLSHSQAHAQRLEAMPWPAHPYLMTRAQDGAVVAAAQAVVEHGLVGLYDVCTAPTERGRGYARALCTQVLREVCDLAPATIGYLQVDADNHPARRVYQRLGFADAYRYHYRVRPGTST